MLFLAYSNWRIALNDAKATWFRRGRRLRVREQHLQETGQRGTDDGQVNAIAEAAHALHHDRVQGWSQETGNTQNKVEHCHSGANYDTMTIQSTSQHLNGNDEDGAFKIVFKSWKMKLRRVAGNSFLSDCFPATRVGAHTAVRPSPTTASAILSCQQLYFDCNGQIQFFFSLSHVHGSSHWQRFRQTTDGTQMGKVFYH